jgi:hypothetical protein
VSSAIFVPAQSEVARTTAREPIGFMRREWRMASSE